MLNVPKLRFSEFSGAWEENIFKNIVKLQRGSSPRPIVKYITSSENGVNWIKIGDIVGDKNFISSTKEKITKEGAKKSRKVSVGEIILSNSMSYGKPIILNIDGYIHDGWFVIRGFDDNFDKTYLLQVLGSDWIQKQYKRLAAGGVVNNISSELVNSVKINLPQKPEQQKIATFLTAIDQKIEQLTQKEKHLQAYKKGVMQKIFSQEIRFRDDNGGEFEDWVEKKLGEQCFNISSGKTKAYENGKYDVYGSTGIIGKTDILTHTGDYVLVARVGANAGFINYVNGKFSVTDNTLIVDAKKDKILPKFVKSLLYQFNLNKLVFGSGQPLITGSQLKSLKLQFPSLKEQTKIANFLSSIDQKIEQVTQQIEESKKFKKGLLQQMFV